MGNQAKYKEATAIRKVMFLIMTDVPLADSLEESARNLLDEMRSEAKEQGISDADVVRAVMRPVFRTQRGSDCWTCKARREELREKEVNTYQTVEAKSN